MIVLEIRQESRQTSIACRVKVNERVASWLVTLADLRETTPAEVALSMLKMIAEDDESAHGGGAVPEGATVQ